MSDRRSWIIRDGDYVVIEGVGIDTAADADADINDMVREATTPIGSCTTSAYDAYGLLEMDKDYGNVLYQLLNTPLRDLPVELILAENSRIFGGGATTTLVGIEVDPTAIERGIFRVVPILQLPNGTVRKLALDHDGRMLRIVN